MSDSVIQPETDRNQSEEQAGEPDASLQNAQESIASDTIQDTISSAKIIWTPAFLLIFALTLVLGLSAESLFTQGWYASLFGGTWIILTQVILATLGWLGLGSVTRSRWIRVGSIFGGLSSAFMLLNIFLNLQGLNPNAPLQSYLNVATCIALLGAYIGLSIKNTLLSAWDSWLFFLVPILAAVGVMLTYYLTSQANILTIENALAAAALIAGCLFWWLRPSCWKKQPAPTFLFGLVPVILLALAPINMSLHNFFLLQVTWSSISVLSNVNNFFFAQVVQLCLLLGCMRMIQSEKREVAH
ncbi:MAG: hypothetical protein ABI234_05680 [Ktedonobacteraceae bacterium]